MSNSMSVTIKDGVEYEGHGIPAGEGVGYVVPLNQGTRQATVDRIQSNGMEMTTDHGRGLSVRVGGEVTVENPLDDIRDQIGNPVSDIRTVDPKTCSIPIGNTRCSLKTALDMGLIKVDGMGNYQVVEQREPEVNPEVIQKETLVSHDNQETLNQFYQRVSPDIMDAYMSNIVSCMVNDKSAQGVVSDMAQAAGCTPDSLYQWTEGYINQLMNAGMDLAVRKSGGKLSSDEIFDHLDHCSKGFKTQLLLSLHLGNARAIDELLTVVRGKLIV